MKKDYVASWNASVQARKQRKFVANAPLHRRIAFFGAHLSKELRTKFGRRSLTLRAGDTVKVVRGQHKGKTGKVREILRRRRKITVEGIEVSRREGAKSLVPINPSNVMLIDLVQDRKRRSERKR